MAEEIKTPMSDFDKVEQVKDTAEFILLQDGVNARVEAPIFEQKILNKTNGRYLGKSEKGAPNGVASLDENKKIPNENLTFGEIKSGDANVVSGGDVYDTFSSYNYSELTINLNTIHSSFDDFSDGYVNPNNGKVLHDYNPALSVKKFVKYDIPTNALSVNINMDNWAGWAIHDINDNPLASGDVRKVKFVELPAKASVIYATIKTDADEANLLTNGFVFTLKDVNLPKKLIKSLDRNGVLTDNKLKDIGLSWSSFKAGYISPSRGVIMSPEFEYNKHAEIDLADGVRWVKSGLSIHAGFSFTDANLVPIKWGAILNGEYIEVPNGAKKILITVRTQEVVCDLNKDFVSQNYFKGVDFIINNGVDENLGVWLGETINTFVGDDLRFYTESVFSGYVPRKNFQIDWFGDAMQYNSDKGRFCLVSTASPYYNKTIGFRVKDFNGNILFEKKGIINCKPKPTKLNITTTNEFKLQAMFIGDSLFHANDNEIGKEYLRMLTTNGDKVIQGNEVLEKPYNLSKNIELVGNRGVNLNKHTIANKLSIIMTGKNTHATETYRNPFYNPNSSQPDEIGSDGFNKRVDFKWFIQNICGAGRTPTVIYLACGVNDIVDAGWEMEALDAISDKMIKVVARLKKACDEIVRKNSYVRIVVVNHQFYPLNEGHYGGFDCAWQRKVWVRHYNNYANKIKTTNDEFGKKVSDYCYLLDASSQFDVDNGYTYTPISKNPRTTDMQTYVQDTVHIGKIGSYMYADALLRDFMYRYGE